MSAHSLDGAPEVRGYACPWCPVVVEEGSVLVSAAVVRFEQHLDAHFATRAASRAGSQGGLAVAS